MSHEIFGERFYAARQPAWHGLGLVTEEPLGAPAALEAIGGDYKFSLRPLSYPTDFAGSPAWIETEFRAIVRDATDDDPEDRIFGAVKGDYEIVQNGAIASILEPITSQWPVETIGVLRDGRDIFFALDAGEMEIGGEKVRNFFLVFDRKDGMTSLKVLFTPVRVVCANTLSVGLREATVTAHLPHNKGVEQQLEFRVNLMDRLAKAMKATEEKFRIMAEHVLNEAEIETVFSLAYPHPPTPAKVRLMRDIDNLDQLPEEFTSSLTKAERKWMDMVNMMDRRREAAQESLAKMNEGRPELADTAWYVYNAVAEVEDFRKGPKADDTNSLADALFGTRAATKRKAFNQALALVEKS